MDYRQLLVKYLAQVIYQAGESFVYGFRKPEFVTDEEWAELEKLEDEARQIEYNLE